MAVGAGVDSRRKFAVRSVSPARLNVQVAGLPEHGPDDHEPKAQPEAGVATAVMLVPLSSEVRTRLPVSAPTQIVAYAGRHKRPPSLRCSVTSYLPNSAPNVLNPVTVNEHVVVPAHGSESQKLNG